MERTLDRLAAAPSQSEEMFYGYHLRTIRIGWNEDLRKRYFSWLNRAESNKGDYTGGNHFGNFLKMVRKEAVKTLGDGEKKSLAAFIEKRETVAPVATPDPRSFVKKWTYADLEATLNEVDHGRRFKRGKALYTELCSKCHLMNGRGGAIGPDLTSVGNKYSSTDLLRELIEPSTVISDQYETSLLMLKNGTVVRGRIVSEDKETVRIMTDPANPDRIDSVKISDISRRKVSPVSMMPTGLLTTLKRNDIFDLMMFVLAAGKVTHPAFDQ